MGLNGFRMFFYFFRCPNGQIFEHVLYQNDVCDLYFLTIFLRNLFQIFLKILNFGEIFHNLPPVCVIAFHRYR